MEYKNNIVCNPGFNVVSGACAKGQVDHIQQVEGVDKTCKDGMYTKNAGLTALDDRQCQWCPDLKACHNSGTSAVCWGQKNQMVAFYDAISGLNLDERRLPT